MVAILPYTKMPDTDEITFQKGDIFFVHNDLGDGWLWVTAHRCRLHPGGLVQAPPWWGGAGSTMVGWCRLHPGGLV